MSSFFEEFKKFTWYQKSFFVLVILGLIFYGLLHGGLIKLPAARATDCSTVTDAKIVEIKMLKDKFEPNDLQVKVCDTLKFINISDEDKWPAVGPHPTHTAYPGFDANRNIKPGQSFEFQVNRIGTYSFHDHLNDAIIGKLKIIK